MLRKGEYGFTAVNYMERSVSILNELLVKLFNDILTIEQGALQDTEYKDISVTEVHTIEAMGMYEPHTMSEVAYNLKITVGTLTTAVNNLVKKGYVERKRIEEDRRVVLIQLTKRGKMVYRIHEKFHFDMVKETVNGMTKQEENILVNYLEKLNSFFKVKYNLCGKKEHQNA